MISQHLNAGIYVRLPSAGIGVIIMFIYAAGRDVILSAAGMIKKNALNKTSMAAEIRVNEQSC